jgi:hypothetical protein
MELVRPTHFELPGYVAALRTGWSADNLRGELAAKEELGPIESDPERFLASLHDPVFYTAVVVSQFVTWRKAVAGRPMTSACGQIVGPLLEDWSNVRFAPVECRLSRASMERTGSGPVVRALPVIGYGSLPVWWSAIHEDHSDYRRRR